MQAIHYTPDNWRTRLCKPRRPAKEKRSRGAWAASDNPERVTCKRCLSRMAKQTADILAGREVRYSSTGRMSAKAANFGYSYPYGAGKVFGYDPGI